MAGAGGVRVSHQEDLDTSAGPPHQRILARCAAVGRVRVVVHTQGRGGG